MKIKSINQMNTMNRISMVVVIALVAAGAVGAAETNPAPPKPTRPPNHPSMVDTTGVRGKVLCGYQGWFRCPKDATDLGWCHWSRDTQRIATNLLSFEMWPDMSEYSATERYPAPGFTYPGGRQAELFSSDDPRTVLRHFEWMRDYGIDGVWVQHFLVGLPGGPDSRWYPSHMRVLNHIRAAALKTGRGWALSYDFAQMPPKDIYDVLTSDWKKMVDEKIVEDPRYLRQGGKPVVQLWGFFNMQNMHDVVTPELANRLIDFFHAPGRYSAYLVNGVDWDWRNNPDPAWQKLYRRCDALTFWSVSLCDVDKSGVQHALMKTWAEDKRECDRLGILWFPVVWPGFGSANVCREPAGHNQVSRQGGRLLWEQFHELSKLGVDTVYVAMFDEVDEGTAIFKVTSSFPTQGFFVGYEGLPSDWYLRLVGEATRRLHAHQPVPPEIPFKP